MLRIALLYTEQQKDRPGNIDVSYLRLKYQKYILWLFMNTAIITVVLVLIFRILPFCLSLK